MTRLGTFNSRHVACSLAIEGPAARGGSQCSIPPRRDKCVGQRKRAATGLTATSPDQEIVHIICELRHPV
jgi:hypothetical protein